MFTTIRPQSSIVTTMASEKLRSGSFDPNFRLGENVPRMSLIVDRCMIEMDTVFIPDQFRFLGNWPPTPPLSHNFALNEKLGEG